MSATGYTEIVEYIAEECLEYCDSLEKIETEVDNYMENLKESVKEYLKENL